MQLKYTITDEDNKRFIACNFQNQDKRYRFFSHLIFIVAILYFIITLISQNYKVIISSLFLVGALYYVYFIAPKNSRKKYLKKLEQSEFLNEERTIMLENEQVTLKTKSRTLSHEYTNIEKISTIDNYFVIISFKYNDSITIPNSAFENNNQKIEFINTLKLKAGIL